VGIGDQMQAIAEPAFDLAPERTGTRIDPHRFMLPPVGIRIRALARFSIDPSRAVALNGLAVKACLFASKSDPLSGVICIEI